MVQVKQKTQNKKTIWKKIIKVLGIIFILVIALIIAMLIKSILKNETKNNKIVATKIENEQNIKIKYTIKINDYEIESAIKEIKFETKQEAEAEYNRYKIINKYERREIGLQLKNKKLVLTMPENQLLQDIEYNKEKIITLTDDGREIETINQNELKQCLINKGYIIK